MSAHPSTSHPGVWDLAALAQPPAITWVSRLGRLHTLYYENVPYRGQETRVFAYLCLPDGSGPHPAMVLVHGGDGKAFPEWAQMWAARGYVALAMDLSGHGPNGARHPHGGPEEADHEIFELLSAGITDCWSYHAVAAVLGGVSLVAALPEVDRERLGITGISWGGYLTCIVVGLEERLKVAIPVYGCGYLYEDSAWAGILAGLPEAERRQWIALFDPSRYLPYAHLPMLWVNGTSDIAYPLGSYQKSYRLPSGERALSITVGMPHGHVAGWSPLEIELYAAQFLRDGTPLPRLGLLDIPDQAARGAEAHTTFFAALPAMCAALHCTADTLPWLQRRWRTLPARIEGNHIWAPLPPERPLVAFLTLTDSRGATVSTEHVVIGG